MAKTFNELALDLKDYIVEKHANYKGLKNISMQRYNNLSVSMNSKRFGAPHVIVKVGMSEIVLSIPDGNKVAGGLGMDERFVSMWLSSDTTITDLEAQWKVIKLEELSQDK